MINLGKAVQINIGISNLGRSLAFYDGLGFHKIEDSLQPYPWARLTDGQNLILLNQDGNIYIGLVYFSNDAARRVADLERQGIQFIQRRVLEGKLQMAVFIGPGGLVVGLLNQNPKGMPKPPGWPITRCGAFGEFGIAVADYQVAAAFWHDLGFSTLHESDEPYPWGILSDTYLSLGLHQTDNYGGEAGFSGPALTYYAVDMADRLELLKKDGYELTNEMPGAGGRIAHGILHGPDGELFFLHEGEI